MQNIKDKDKKLKSYGKDFSPTKELTRCAELSPRKKARKPQNKCFKVEYKRMGGKIPFAAK